MTNLNLDLINNTKTFEELNNLTLTDVGLKFFKREDVLTEIEGESVMIPSFEESDMLVDEPFLPYLESIDIEVFQVDEVYGIISTSICLKSNKPKLLDNKIIRDWLSDFQKAVYDKFVEFGKLDEYAGGTDVELIEAKDNGFTTLGFSKFGYTVLAVSNTQGELEVKTSKEFKNHKLGTEVGQNTLYFDTTKTDENFIIFNIPTLVYDLLEKNDIWMLADMTSPEIETYDLNTSDIFINKSITEDKLGRVVLTPLVSHTEQVFTLMSGLYVNAWLSNGLPRYVISPYDEKTLVEKPFHISALAPSLLEHFDARNKAYDYLFADEEEIIVSIHDHIDYDGEIDLTELLPLIRATIRYDVGMYEIFPMIPEILSMFKDAPEDIKRDVYTDLFRLIHKCLLAETMELDLSKYPMSLLFAILSGNLAEHVVTEKYQPIEVTEEELKAGELLEDRVEPNPDTDNDDV